MFGPTVNLPPVVVLSIFIQQKYFFALNLSCPRSNHVGSLFTYEEQVKAGLWHNVYFCHSNWPSWCNSNRYRLPDTKQPYLWPCSCKCQISVLTNTLWINWKTSTPVNMAHNAHNASFPVVSFNFFYWVWNEKHPFLSIWPVMLVSLGSPLTSFTLCGAKNINAY